MNRKEIEDLIVHVAASASADMQPRLAAALRELLELRAVASADMEDILPSARITLAEIANALHTHNSFSHLTCYLQDLAVVPPPGVAIIRVENNVFLRSEQQKNSVFSFALCEGSAACTEDVVDAASLDYNDMPRFALLSKRSRTPTVNFIQVLEWAPSQGLATSANAAAWSGLIKEQLRLAPVDNAQPPAPDSGLWPRTQ